MFSIGKSCLKNELILNFVFVRDQIDGLKTEEVSNLVFYAQSTRMVISGQGKQTKA